MTYLSGFVSIIGSPNVGKSTLMNRMVGQKVSIVSQKAQTTRNRIMGIVSRAGIQMVFLDTPGVTTPKNRLGEYMLKVAYESLNEVDAVLFLVDAIRGMGEKDEALIGRLKHAKSPVIAVINKTDSASLANVQDCEQRLNSAGCFRMVHRLSALNGNGVEELLIALSGLMPEGPQYFPEDMPTDQPERVLCAEIIREKALNHLQDEIPHGLGVDIEKMAARDGGLYDIAAVIYCERESHKGIIIGKGGSMLKLIGSEARKDMEWMIGSRINLKLWVKVKDGWRNSPSVIRELGYE